MNYVASYVQFMEKNISQYYESLLLLKNTSLPQKSIFVHHENKSILRSQNVFKMFAKNMMVIMLTAIMLMMLIMMVISMKMVIEVMLIAKMMTMMKEALTRVSNDNYKFIRWCPEAWKRLNVSRRNGLRWNNYLDDITDDLWNFSNGGSN